MSHLQRPRSALTILLLLLLGPVCGLAAEPPQLAVRRVIDEAEGVLALLDRRARGEEITDQAWLTLTATEGYRRLKERDESYGVAGASFAAH